MTKQDEDVMPAMYDYCVQTYHKMLEQAQAVVQVGDSDEVRLGAKSDDKNQIIVYEGFLTALITQDLRLSVPYYSMIRKHLKNMGCIRQLKRGGGSSPSQWEMIYEPTEALFMKVQEPKAPSTTKNSVMNKRIDELTNEVVKLRERTQALEEFLAAQFGTEEV